MGGDRFVNLRGERVSVKLQEHHRFLRKLSVVHCGRACTVGCEYSTFHGTDGRHRLSEITPGEYYHHWKHVTRPSVLIQHTLNVFSLITHEHELQVEGGLGM